MRSGVKDDVSEQLLAERGQRALPELGVGRGLRDVELLFAEQGPAFPDRVAELDEEIAGLARGWDLERIAPLERAILRTARSS